MMRVRLRPALLLAGLAATLAGAAGPARAQSLVADLSEHLVQITTGFTGSRVLLFGAIEGEGDVVVVVRGPSGRAVVRRKDRIAGVWVNRDDVSFADVPAFYAVAASRPLEAFLPEATAARHQIGLARLDMPASVPGRRAAEYHEALLRNQGRRGLFLQNTGEVAFLGGRLFRTTVEFPANVPTGTYSVEVFLVQDGRVASAQTTPLIISKAGLEAEIFDFANREPALYGLIAIALAMVAGWGAGLVFRKA